MPVLLPIPPVVNKFELVEFSSIISAKEKLFEFLIISSLIISIELPTVLNDWAVLPAEITITGILSALRIVIKKLFITITTDIKIIFFLSLF